MENGEFVGTPNISKLENVLSEIISRKVCTSVKVEIRRANETRVFKATQKIVAS